MIKQRLDSLLVAKKLATSRSQAENLILLGEVQVDGRAITKPDYFTKDTAIIVITASEHYVSRAGLKLASVAKELSLNFNKKIVLDVGSSTGGFTDYALQNGATKVIAVDVGTNQLHPSLRNNQAIDLFEQTDIRNLYKLRYQPDIILIDVSFISLKEVLPHIVRLARNAQIVAMLKPQFELRANAKHKGVIKNEKLRRDAIKDFEFWLKKRFKIIKKTDSKIAGSKGNLERFYLLRVIDGVS